MYAMTDNTAYADAAISWMLSVASWSKWGVETSLWFNHSILMRGYAFAYSVLRDYMTAANRQTIIMPLAREIDAAKTSHLDLAESGTPPFYTYPNHWWTLVATIGLIGLAVGPDHPDASSWVDYGITWTQEAISPGRGDGGPDGDFTIGLIHRVMPFLFALKGAGLDLFTGSDFLKNHAYYYIYLYYPSESPGFLALEDAEHHVNLQEAGHGSSRSAVDFMWLLANEYNNAYAHKFAELYAEKDDIYAFMWKSPTLTSQPFEQLPSTRWFRNAGYVIWKTGWGGSDLNVVFKSGSSRGHAHNNQNEFMIWNNGDKITGSPGYLNDGEDDTQYHNCILTNSRGQGAEPGDDWNVPLGTRGLIEQVQETPHYNYARGDASAVYNGQAGNGDLDKWLRHIILMKNPNYLIVYDDVVAPGPAQIDFVMNSARFNGWDPSFAPPKRNMSVNGDTVTINGALTSVIVEPSNFNYDIQPYYREGSWYVHNYDITKVKPAVAEAQQKFLTVHFPNTVLPVEKVNINNVIGAKVINGEYLDLILFNRNGLPVDEYIELGGSYIANDGGNYSFESTGVRVQFQGYQVLKLRRTGSQPIGDWDVNSDGSVNVLDLIKTGQHMNETGSPGWIKEDVNKDGIVNVLDIIQIGQHWTG
jgi:hypothetical protein